MTERPIDRQSAPDDPLRDAPGPGADNGLTELRLDPESDSSPPPSDGEGGGARWWVALAALLLVALLLGFWWQRRGRQPAGEQPATAARATAEPADGAVEPATPAMELPPLDASDALVREMIGALSAQPELSRWLVTDGLVRRFVVSVDNVAEGRAPTDHLRILRPSDGFEARRSDDGWVASAESFGRYDTLASVFGSLDVEGTARLIEELQPLLDEAYRDLGYPDARFETTLERAIAHLLEVPDAIERPALVAKLSSYEFADPSLESLSLAQKQLLRMGPDNVRRVQDQLRALGAELGLNLAPAAP